MVISAVAIRWSRGKAAHVGHGEVGTGLSARKVRTGDGRVALLGFGLTILIRRR